MGGQHQAEDDAADDEDPLGHSPIVGASYAAQVADLKDIAEAIGRLRASSSRVVVAITGFGGAGKSTLTKTLVELVPGCVRLRGDDFLDPSRSHLRSPDWDGVERDRIRTEVIEPFRREEPAVYRPYDWDIGTLGPPVTLPSAEVLLVDSIGLAHPELENCFDLMVWVDVDLETAGLQGRARDRRAGSDHDALWDEVWIPNDRDFAETYDPVSRADLLYLPSPAGGGPGRRPGRPRSGTRRGRGPT